MVNMTRNVLCECSLFTIDHISVKIKKKKKQKRNWIHTIYFVQYVHILSYYIYLILMIMGEECAISTMSVSPTLIDLPMFKSESYT